MPLTAVQARARLENMLAVASEPLLSEAEVDALFTGARRVDRYGRGFASDTWEPTFDLEAAAAEGWRWKAAKAAGDYQFAADGASFSRQQVADNCLKMAAMYQARAGGGSVSQVTAGVGSVGPDHPDQLGNWNY